MQVDDLLVSYGKPLKPKTPQFIFVQGVTTYIGFFTGHPNNKNKNGGVISRQSSIMQYKVT